VDKTFFRPPKEKANKEANRPARAHRGREDGVLSLFFNVLMDNFSGRYHAPSPKSRKKIKAR
jgi:hypothetical protein